MTARRALTALNVLYLVSVLLCLAAGAGLWQPWGLQPLHAWAVAAALGVIGLIVERQLERRAAATAAAPTPAPDPFTLPAAYSMATFTPEQQRQLAEWLDEAYQERNRPLGPGNITFIHFVELPFSSRAVVSATVEGDTTTPYLVEVDHVPRHILDILACAHE